MGLLHSRRALFSGHVHLANSIKRIAWMRTVRWLGWGFGEALIPLFIFRFSQSYAEAGAFRAAYDIALLLALPVIGRLADRIPAKSLILFALALYPLVGISYFLAGAFGIGVFIIFARVINGVTWGVEDMAVDTYYRRVAQRRNLGSSFGYIDTWSNFGWIVAAFLGMLLVPYVSIHYLLLIVTPTSLIALWIALRIPRDSVARPKKFRFAFFASYKKLWDEWRSWDRHLWLLCILVLFTGLIEALMWFFIPIDAYVEGAAPALVVLLTITATIPSLFGYALGKIADHENKHRLVAFGLAIVAVVVLGLAAFPSYAFKLAASFFLGILLEQFSVIQRSLVTTLGSASLYGQRGGAFASVATIGGLIGPLVLGFALDGFGFSGLTIGIAGAALLLAFVFGFWPHGQKRS
ncbi:MAG: MFS transporter [Patescibacteria group bacterium]